MDIYRLIESTAVRNYLQDIGYSLNSMECAVLILSNMTMTAEERETALSELMASMPDAPLTEKQSLFSELRRYIALQKKGIQDFYSPVEDGVYCVTVYSDDKSPSNYICKNMDDCLRFASCTTPAQIRIQKRKLEAPYVPKELILNARFEPLRIVNRLETEPCQGLSGILRQSKCLKIPLPFRAGDIVCLPSSVPGNPHEPMVIDGEKGTPPFDWVHANGVFKASSRGITLDFLPEFERFEYYTDELKGRDRILKPVSHFLKGDIRNLEVFITAILKIYGEEQINRDDVEYIQDIYEDEANYAF